MLGVPLCSKHISGTDEPLSGGPLSSIYQLASHNLHFSPGFCLGHGCHWFWPQTENANIIYTVFLFLGCLYINY